MGNYAIRVENLGKEYTIGQFQGRYKSLRDTLTSTFTAPIKKIIHRPGAIGYQKSTIWALKDVSFEIKPGEVVGIIGRNGAGKSTLLKILARITEPTTGEIHMRGRVGSLLEVGTGFHPELTGRENIFLNGAILGMRRQEIQRKFDEIVDFAEIEKFIDTPTKHYSSGMYMRLAFAVAAHLEPEILLVDEVLAVGDADFQKKCLGKMGEVAREGRTVLFVSHNMASIVSLCSIGFLFNKGLLTMVSPIDQVVSAYLQDQSPRAEFIPFSSETSKKLIISKIGLMKEGLSSSSFYNSDILILRIEFSLFETITGAQIAFEIYNEMDLCIFSSTNQDSDPIKRALNPGFYIYECPIPLDFFRTGRYKIIVSSSIPSVEILDIVDTPLIFDVIDTVSPINKLGQGRRGLILPVLSWKLLDRIELKE